MKVRPILMMSLIVGINSCFKEKEDQSKSWIWSSAIGSKHEGINSADECLSLCINDYECMAMTYKVEENDCFLYNVMVEEETCETACVSRHIDSPVPSSCHHIKNTVNPYDARLLTESCLPILSLCKENIKLKENQKKEMIKLKEEIQEGIDEIERETEQTRPPIGSIIAWLPDFSQSKDIPEGWQRCDGSTIMTGPFKGKTTPDLNEANRFIRGGLDQYSSQIQEDAVQDHTHLDKGHTHQDAGHSHTDSGHIHEFKDMGGKQKLFGRGTESDQSGAYLLEASGKGDYYKKWVYRTDSNKAKISTSKANIRTSTSGMSGIKNGRKADETRPKSMFAVFIMRIF